LRAGNRTDRTAPALAMASRGDKVSGEGADERTDEVSDKVSDEGTEEVRDKMEDEVGEEVSDKVSTSFWGARGVNGFRSGKRAGWDGLVRLGAG
jgi:hypothetical protein